MNTESLDWTMDMSTAIDLQLKLHSVDPSQTTLRRVLVRMSRWGSSPYTQAVILVLICVDVVLLLCGVQLHGFNSSKLHWTSVSHGFCLAFFSLESLIRISSELTFKPRKRTKRSPSSLGVASSSWQLSAYGFAENISHTKVPVSAYTTWDAILVVLGIVGAILWGLHSGATILPSIIRIYRLPFLSNSPTQNILLRPLQLILSAIGGSLYVLFLSICMLLLNMLFFAVLAMSALQPEIEEQMGQHAIDRFGSQTVKNCRYAFSSLPASMSTLFALSTGGQWHEIAFPIIFFKPWAFALFFLHAVIASGIIIGLIYGTLCLSLQRSIAREAELDESSRMKVKKSVIDEMTRIFEGIDIDGDGYLTWQEFHHNREHNDVLIRLMETLDIQESEILLMWDIMDRNRDGHVSREEFLKFMWHICCDQGKWSRLKTMHCAAESQFRAEEVSKQVSKLQEDLLGHHRLLEKILEKVQRPDEIAVRGVSENAVEATTSNTEEARDLDGDEHDVNEEQLSAIKLMRSVDSGQVSRYGNDEVVTFWAGGAFIDKDSDKEFNMSGPCQKCDYFVSHCWNAPAEWLTYFQCNNRLETYGYIKAVELHNVLLGTHKSPSGSEDLVGPRRSYIGTSLWIDKCCIPQNDKRVKAACVALLEEFMQLSNGFIVLLSWQYFTRLWCVYEWACFLRTHTAASVELGFDAFLRSRPDETLPLYLDSIERLSVRGSQCFYQSDHEILEAKVFQYYNGETPNESFAAFERFAKCTAICLMAKQLVLWRARTSVADENAWLEPFRKLADKLEFKSLVKVLRRAKPAKWFAQCQGNQESFEQVAMYWFQNDCIQYLMQERARAVRRLPKMLQGLNNGTWTLDTCTASRLISPRVGIVSSETESTPDAFELTADTIRLDTARCIQPAGRPHSTPPGLLHVAGLQPRATS